MRLSLLAFIAAAVASIACSDAGPTPPSASDASPRPPSFECASYVHREIPGLFSAVRDLNGDGLDEMVFFNDDTLEVFAGPIVTTPLLRVTDMADSLLRVESGDLNGDGHADLIIARPWKSKVAIFFGPFSGEELTFDEAPLLVHRPRSSDFENLFGFQIRALKLNDDKHDDLIITAPAEREEACAGSESTWILYGPLEVAANSTIAPDLEIPTETFSCLGLVVQERNGRLLLSGKETHAFDLPITDSVPTESFEAMEGLFDFDGDALDDRLSGRDIHFGNGQVLSLSIPREIYFEGIVVEGIERPLAHITSFEGSSLRLMEGLESEPTKWTSILDLEQQGLGTVRAGDINGDGGLDLVLRGNPSVVRSGHLLTCRP